MLLSTLTNGNRTRWTVDNQEELFKICHLILLVSSVIEHLQSVHEEHLYEEEYICFFLENGY